MSFPFCSSFLRWRGRTGGGTVALGTVDDKDTATEAPLEILSNTMKDTELGERVVSEGKVLDMWHASVPTLKVVACMMWGRRGPDLPLTRR